MQPLCVCVGDGCTQPLWVCVEAQSQQARRKQWTWKEWETPGTYSKNKYQTQPNSCPDEHKTQHHSPIYYSSSYLIRNIQLPTKNYKAYKKQEKAKSEKTKQASESEVYLWMPNPQRWRTNCVTPFYIRDWAPTDFDICGVSWNQPPIVPQGTIIYDIDVGIVRPGI